MTEQEAFRRAICENPYEDTHRLAFADWLEEHGESPGGGGRSFRWTIYPQMGRETREAHGYLPNEFRHFLPNFRSSLSDGRRLVYSFASNELAHVALSRACADYGRWLNGLPRLYTELVDGVVTEKKEVGREAAP